jgi:hypothetical protein
MRKTTQILDLASALSPLVTPAVANATTRDDWNQTESLGGELMGFTVDQHNRGVGAPKHGSHYSHSSHSSGLY